MGRLSTLEASVTHIRACIISHLKVRVKPSTVLCFDTKTDTLLAITKHREAIEKATAMQPRRFRSFFS